MAARTDPWVPTSQVYTFVEVAVRVSGDTHWFLVPTPRDLASQFVLALVRSRATLTTYDGRDRVRGQTINPESIISHGELDVGLIRDDEHSFYMPNGARILGEPSRRPSPSLLHG